MKRRGFTLVETVLATSLLAGLLTLIALFFVRARQYTVETETYSSVQRAAGITVRKLADDLYSASSSHAQYYGDSVIFLSSDPLEGSAEPRLQFDPITGKIIWKKWVLYAFDAGTNQIYREEVGLVSPTSELGSKPDPDVDPAYFAGNASATRRVIANNVKDFKVQGTGVGFRVGVTCQESAPVTNRTESDKLVEVTVESEISVLN